jgi:hypothetical protein
LGENIVNYKFPFVLLFGFLSCLSQNDQSVYHFSLDYLYPQKNFHQIESLSKELWSDLDLLLNDEQAKQKIMQESEIYLYDQSIKLNKAVNNLILNETEARIYLTEDIQYLVAILECIENKYGELMQSLLKVNEATLIDTYAIFRQAKEALIDLLENNHEVIPS